MQQNVEILPEEPPPVEKEQKETQVSSQSDEQELKKLESLLEEALFGKKKEKAATPVMYVLNSGGEQWFYGPKSRSMIRIPGGTQLVVADPEPDDDGRVLCYCDFGYIMVPEADISPLGYN